MNRDIMNAIFPEEMKLIMSGRCPVCAKAPLRDKVGELVFRDELSREAYNISRICEPCQDVAADFFDIFVDGEQAGNKMYSAARRRMIDRMSISIDNGRNTNKHKEI